ncbi:MAG: type II secretion system protein [bacterium]|nr:type II secretion system protein [bacterium]
MINNKKRGGIGGFTLIELLVVIAIIGILSSIVLASLNSARKKGKDARRVADIKQIQLALEMYYDDNNGSYPTTLDALVSGGQIASLPVPPNGTGQTDYTYAYYPATSPTYYHLGAILEEPGHVALNSDKDCNSSTGSPDCGAGAVTYLGTPFDGTNDPVNAVYDVTP